MKGIIEDQTQLAAWVSSQNSRVDMAVAFWGQGALEALNLVAGREARILLDLTSGGTNPDVVTALMGLKGVKVKQLDRLHAKVYIGQTELIIGSANASANGLGAEGRESTHWKELSLLTDCRETLAQASSWFGKQWRAGRTIEEIDLERARRSWKNRRRTRPPTSKGRILDIARRSPAELKDRNFYVNVCTEALTTAEETEGDAFAATKGAEPYYFLYWREMPLSSTLICFGQWDGKSIVKDKPSVCFTPDKRPGKFGLVRPGDLGEYEYGDLSEWRLRLRYHRELRPEEWENGGPCVELTEFVQMTNAAVAVRTTSNRK